MKNQLFHDFIGVWTSKTKNKRPFKETKNPQAKPKKPLFYLKPSILFQKMFFWFFAFTTVIALVS